MEHKIEEVKYKKSYDSSAKVLLVNAVTLGTMFTLFVFAFLKTLTDTNIYSIVLTIFSIWICKKSLNDAVISLRHIEKIINYDIKENE